MTKHKPIKEIMPWSKDELEKLLLKVIDLGVETAKIDFKLEIETNTPEQKSELLKDICAISNTYDLNYDDYGFLIYGVKSKSIIGISTKEENTDNFQNHIEQLLKNNITPTPQIQIVSFETKDNKKWGVIVIPPDNNKPHMFFKDFSCPTNPSKNRKKGEWFVRHGSTTDPASAEDLSIINQKQIEITLEPLKESIKNLQARVLKTEEQYNSALFKIIETALKNTTQNRNAPKVENTEIASDIEEVVSVDLASRFKSKLLTPKDKLSEELISEAKKIREYIDGANTGLTWIPQLNNPEDNKKILENLEEKVKPFIDSVAMIILKDEKNIYKESLIKAIKILCKSIDAPSGTQYNRIGQGIRYYPLYLLLYVIFICGVVSNKGSLLKDILNLQIKHPRTKNASPITDVYFFAYEGKALINDAYKQRWCEPIAQRIRQFISDNISEHITEMSEAEYFFKGEFVLALSNINKVMNDGKQAEHRIPLGGLYLYLYECNEPITDLITELPDWLEKLYDHPLNELLDMFDKNATKMSGQGCFATGTHGLKTRELYNLALSSRAKKTR